MYTMYLGQYYRIERQRGRKGKEADKGELQRGREGERQPESMEMVEKEDERI